MTNRRKSKGLPVTLDGFLQILRIPKRVEALSERPRQILKPVNVIWMAKRTELERFVVECNGFVGDRPVERLPCGNGKGPPEIHEIHGALWVTNRAETKGLPAKRDCFLQILPISERVEALAEPPCEVSKVCKMIRMTRRTELECLAAKTNAFVRETSIRRLLCGNRQYYREIDEKSGV